VEYPKALPLVLGVTLENYDHGLRTLNLRGMGRIENG
jgi:hypothetical protein